MVSIMLCYIKMREQQGNSGRKRRGEYFVFFCFLLFLSCFSPSAYAEKIAVHKAEVHYSAGSYQLSAYFDISFNFIVEQALMQGVPLYFVSEFILTRPRWYWLDETVTQHEQAIKLSYNTLTSQYRITRGSIFQNFTSLDAAINTIKHQSSAPVAAELFKSGNNYIAAVRMRLDVTQLPKPLQVNALANDDWNLDSGWYKWIVHSDTVIQQK